MQKDKILFVFQENEKAITDSVEKFNAEMKALSEKFPVSDETFSKKARDAKDCAIKVFLSCAFNIEKHNEFRIRLEEQFTEIVVKFQEKNNQESENKCTEVVSTKAFKNHL